MKTSIKLTKRAVEVLKAPDPSGKQTLHWDAELKGFGVLCSGTTAGKTYVVQRKLPGGLTRRITIGAVNAIDLDDKEDGARARARKVLGEFYSGVDPKAERRKAARRGVTLRATLDAYLAARKDLREKSRKDYQASVERHLAPWLDLALRGITGDMVEERHRAIQREVERRQTAGTIAGGIRVTGEATANGAMRAFRALWNFVAERDSELPANPVRRLKRQWFAVERRERLVRTDELPAFYAAVDGLPSRTHRDYLMLLLFTGLRRNEGAALLWEEVALTDRLIRLPARRTKAGRKLDLPMSDFVRDLLVARRALGNDGPFGLAPTASPVILRSRNSRWGKSRRRAASRCRCTI